jgi:hypothetical protein
MKMPLVSTAKVMYIGGLNSSGNKGRWIEADGYDVTMPRANSGFMANMSACFAKIGFGGDISDIKDRCLSCTKPDIIVGSSQGGAVAMALQKDWPDVRLLLIAPAWRTFGVLPETFSSTVILHGKDDYFVPYRDSEHLADKNKCTLVGVKDNHTLDQSYYVILDELDKISIDLGKHKSDEVIRAEWAAYKEAIARLVVPRELSQT